MLPFVFSFLFYKNNKSLHHFIILPIMYIPHQDWLGGGGGLTFFLLVKRWGCQKILYDVGVMKKICPFKIYPLPPFPPPAV